MNVPKTDLTKLFESVKASERTRGIVVAFGARELPPEGAPPRLVFVPGSGDYEAPEHHDNLFDVPLTFEVRAWGETFDHAVDLRGRLLQAVWDFQLSTNTLRLHAIGEEWDDNADTARQGVEVSISFTARDSVVKVPLSSEAGTATVDHEQFSPSTPLGSVITQ